MFKQLGITIGTILLFLGLFIISPLDDVLILTPFALMFGPGVFVAAFAIGLTLILIGALLLGAAAGPAIRAAFVALMANPIILILCAAIIVAVSLIWWFM